MTACELCFLTREDSNRLREAYPELKARLSRFANAGTQLTREKRPK